MWGDAPSNRARARSILTGLDSHLLHIYTFAWGVALYIYMKNHITTQTKRSNVYTTKRVRSYLTFAAAVSPSHSFFIPFETLAPNRTSSIIFDCGIYVCIQLNNCSTFCHNVARTNKQTKKMKRKIYYRDQFVSLCISVILLHGGASHEGIASSIDFVITNVI